MHLQHFGVPSAFLGKFRGFGGFFSIFGVNSEDFGVFRSFWGEIGGFWGPPHIFGVHLQDFRAAQILG